MICHMSHNCGTAIVAPLWPPLEWRKIVGILKDLNPTGFFPAVAFGMQGFFLSNP
jgi:hypothetical protein